MSRLHDLIEQAKASNPELGNALAEEVQRLEDRPTFGLVFERHAPEATELYGRPIAPGDKVHVLNERGSTAKADQTLWRVEDIREDGATGPEAYLLETLPGNQEWDAQAVRRAPQGKTALVENLVVVAEHTDIIYPGFVETGRVDNGPADAPAHTIINAENLHALQALSYTHRHSIDCVYIDPPYNTGAKDWKYNNDYVDGNDGYRHSKWLSFMERRLKLAKELLNPADSVLIVTIDEKEYHCLAMLLEQVFPEANIQMVSSVINPSGAARSSAFSRTDEYIFFVMIGSAAPVPTEVTTLPSPGESNGRVQPKVTIWNNLRRRGSNNRRIDRPNSFYPIFVHTDTKKIFGAGAKIVGDYDPAALEVPFGCFAVLPILPDGSEGTWQLGAPTFDNRIKEGTVRYAEVRGEPAIQYMRNAELARIENGELTVAGRDRNGVLEVEPTENSRPLKTGKTTWNIPAHNADSGGSKLIRAILGDKRFDYPKSLYAVEDALRFFLKDKPNAVVLDFFAGSGTTAHAVMRLNKQDGGNRRSIMVTNNEVSAEEQKALREKGLRPGDTEWEALGIADYVTKPRVTAAITGKTPEGDPIKGDYKFTDKFPMSDGFEANARYFSLEYLNPVMVEYGYAFSRIAPLLWMRAGQVGPVIEELSDRGWEVTDFYAVIENCDDAPAFIEAVKQRPSITHVYIITDNASVYRRVARGLDDSVQAIQLYESYLTNFAINASRVLK